MINLVYLFNFLECGHWCLKYIFRMENIALEEKYERKLMSLYEIKTVMSKYFDNVGCYRISDVSLVNTRALTLIKNKFGSYHYVVIERIKNSYIYYYDPMFYFLRKMKAYKFEKKWAHCVCFYNKK